MAVQTSFTFRFADIEVLEPELRVIRSGEPLAMEPKVFRVLVCLVRNAGRLVTKEELLDAVWGDIAVTENSLTRAIALLRHILGDDPHHPRFVETVTTAGYRFICPVEVIEDSTSTAVNISSGVFPRNQESGQVSVGGRICPGRNSFFRAWPTNGSTRCVSPDPLAAPDSRAMLNFNGFYI